MHRREWLTRATQQAAWLAWMSLFAANGTAHAQARPWRPSAEVFTLGVASGEPRPHSVVLWTRLAPAPLQADGGMPDHAVAVRWEVATDEGFRQVVQRGTTITDAKRAHSVHVEVAGLDSHRPYFYRFLVADQVSPTGRTRTAPLPGANVQRLRVALASCQHFEMGHYAAHREIARSDVDLVLFVGDYVYLYEVKKPHRIRHHALTLNDAPSLADFRVHHANYKLDADLRAAHAAHPWLLMWDDQEIRNDYDGWTNPDNDLDPAALPFGSARGKPISSTCLCRPAEHPPRRACRCWAITAGGNWRTCGCSIRANTAPPRLVLTSSMRLSVADFCGIALPWKRPSSPCWDKPKSAGWPPNWHAAQPPGNCWRRPRRCRQPPCPPWQAPCCTAMDGMPIRAHASA